MRVLSVPAFFVLCMSLGMWVNDRSWNGQVFVYVGEDRAPAAVRTLEEYSSLDRKAIYRSVHMQLLANAQTLKQDGRVGIRLGHPLVNRKGGGKEFGCQVQEHSGAFDRIELVFVGTGVSEDGQVPHMTVTSRCRSATDLNRLETIWIPMSEILSAGAKDQTLPAADANSATVQLQSMPGQWPDSWVLWSVRLYRAGNPDESLSLDAGLLRQARPKLLSFEWKAQ